MDFFLRLGNQSYQWMCFWEFHPKQLTRNHFLQMWKQRKQWNLSGDKGVYGLYQETME
jgi:hypothetical protein